MAFFVFAFEALSLLLTPFAKELARPASVLRGQRTRVHTDSSKGLIYLPVHGQVLAGGGWFLVIFSGYLTQSAVQNILHPW